MRPVVSLVGWLIVALPALALVIELSTHASMNLLMDPIPTWGHVGLIGAVAASTLRARWLLRSPEVRVRAADVGASAAACGISLVYCVCLVPMLFIAALTLLYWPAIATFGLIGIFSDSGASRSDAFFLVSLPALAVVAFSPLLAFFASLVQGRKLGRLLERDDTASRSLFARMFALGSALVVLLELPGLAAHYGLSSGTDEARRLAVLRHLTTTDAMVRVARYGPHNAHLSGWLARQLGWDRADRPVIERRFFRATGESLDAVPPLRLVGSAFPRASWAEGLDGGFDRGQGGRRVGRGLGDVTWADSKLEGEVHPDAGFAYLEWTLVFRNDGATQREARARVRLPPGGVVSRTTLWVNGVPREGSVGSTSAARDAYERVVAVRRDPLLVTADDVDEVMVQCFPIPPDGGEMKIRLGITAPLQPYGASASAVSFPRFVERNFAADAEVGDSVSLRAEGHAVRVGSHGAVVEGEPLPSVWVQDARRSDPQPVAFAWGATAPSPDHLIVVVDGSASVRPHLDEIQAGLDRLARDVSLEIVLARDVPEDLGRDPHSLARARFDGGQKNVPALRHALALAQENDRSAVLWIHGPRPIVLDSVDALAASRWPGVNPVLDFSLSSGRNRLATELAPLLVRDARKQEHWIPAARHGRVDEDLFALADGLESSRAMLVATTARMAAAPGERVHASTSRAGVHLTRLWAWSEAKRRAFADAAEGSARRLALRYELVTPWSGAVVLETDDEYLAASLPLPQDDPDDPSLEAPDEEIVATRDWDAAELGVTKPIPEPGAGWLLGLGLLVVASRHRKAKKAA